MKFHNYVILRETKEGAIPASVKKKANAVLFEIGRQYWDSIPVKEISELLAQFNILMPEDFILTGRDGRDTFEITYNNIPVTNAVLAMQWHKMESGRWEINAYLS